MGYVTSEIVKGKGSIERSISFREVKNGMNTRKMNMMSR